MDIGGPVCLILLSYFFGVGFMQHFLDSVIQYQLSESAAWKRREGQSRKERFLYSRFRDVLPRLAVIWYLIVVAIHPLILAVSIILALAGVPIEVEREIAKMTFIFEAVWMAVLRILFWGSKKTFKVDRWIKKKGIKE